jgi:hypothetical protein
MHVATLNPDEKGNVAEMIIKAQSGNTVAVTDGKPTSELIEIESYLQTVSMERTLIPEAEALLQGNKDYLEKLKGSTLSKEAPARSDEEDRQSIYKLLDQIKDIKGPEADGATLGETLVQNDHLLKEIRMREPKYKEYGWPHSID